MSNIRTRLTSCPKVVLTLHWRTKVKEEAWAVNVVPVHCWSCFQGRDIHRGITCTSLPVVTGEHTQRGGIARGSELGSWRAITTCPWPPGQPQTKARLLLNWILSIEPNTISNQEKSKKLRNNSQKTGVTVTYSCYWSRLRPIHKGNSSCCLERDPWYTFHMSGNSKGHPLQCSWASQSISFVCKGHRSDLLRKSKHLLSIVQVLPMLAWETQYCGQ